MAKKSVVVLGAGFGGLRAAMDIAKELRRLKLLDKYEIVLVDRNDCHVYIPLLYKVATSPEPQHETNCTYDITSLVQSLPIRFLKAEITSLDLPNGDVHLATGEELRADYLLIALGSETNYFGIPGLKENALQLKTLESAKQVRAAIQKAFAKGGTINIVAGGAGPNGIELASGIREWANRAEKENPNLHVSVSIVEALPSIMNGLDARAAKIATERLKKLGVAVMLNAKITGVSANEIGVADGSPIPFDVFIWTGGVKTPETLTELPIAKDQRGRPLTKSDMACVPGTPDLKLAPMVYGLGDSVCFMNPKTGKPVPAVAHVAMLEGRIAAHNVIEEIKHAEFSSHNLLPIVYRPGDYPYVIPIGECWAVAKIGPIVFAGWFGWAFERIVELNYLITIMSPARAWKAWRWM